MEQISLSQSLPADLAEMLQEIDIIPIPANGAAIGQSKHLSQNLSEELLQTGQENAVADIWKNGQFWYNYLNTQNTADNNVLTIKNVPITSVEGV